MIDFNSRRRALRMISGSPVIAAAAGVGVGAGLISTPASASYTVYQVICSSAFPAAFWGSNTPPDPTVTGGDIWYATDAAAHNVKVALQGYEYSLQAYYRDVNVSIAPYKAWVPVATYTKVAVTRRATLSEEESLSPIGSYNGQVYDIEPLEGINIQQVYDNMKQIDQEALNAALQACAYSVGSNNLPAVLTTCGIGAAVVGLTAILSANVAYAQIYGTQGWFVNYGQTLGNLQ
jgi:hypothetical protein